MNSKQAVKEFARSPYAWPGGYPMFALCQDGGALCHKCVKDNYRQIREEQNTPTGSGWEVTAVDVNWEDAALYCDHCGDRVESAYAEE